MKVIVYPGSFDPITNGHLYIAKKALSSFDKVIFLVANNPDKKARFNINERYEMVKEAIVNIPGLEVSYTEGLTVDYLKKVGSHYLLRGIRDLKDMAYEDNYAKLTHELDSSVEFTYIKAPKRYLNISSTMIDKLATEGKDISKLVPTSVVNMYKKR